MVPSINCGKQCHIIEINNSDPPGTHLDRYTIKCIWNQKRVAIIDASITQIIYDHNIVLLCQKALLAKILLLIIIPGRYLFIDAFKMILYTDIYDLLIVDKKERSKKQ